MEPLVAALIVGSALLHAAWNAALKRQPDPEGAVVAILAVAGGLAAAVVPLAQAPAFPRHAGIAWALGAGVCEGGYFVTLARAFRASPFGLVYAVARGGALAAVWPISVLFLGEDVTPLAVGGVVAVTAGLVALGTDRVDGPSARGVAWGAACAGFIAGYHLCYKCALSAGGEPGAIFATALLVALPVGVVRLGRGGWTRAATSFRQSPAAIVVAGLLCTTSFLSFLSALARGGAGAAATLRNTSVIFALLIAWGMGERPSRRQVAGMVGIAVGAVMMGWPR